MGSQKKWLVIGIALIFFPCLAQFNFKKIFDVEVTQNDKPLSYPWTGGLNSPQYNTIDLNSDGKDDLVVFDRYASKVYTFLLEKNKWNYHPEWEHFFPNELSDWVLLRDFNCDGKKDIFTSNLFGITVYVNTSSTGAGPSWRLFNKGEALLTIGLSGPINLKVNLTDIPAIDDIDGDGDLDILFVHSPGNNTIEFHKNQSMEVNGNCDSLQMVRASQRWGNIEDCSCGKFEFDGESCFGSGGRVQHSGGKAITTYDVDRDGDLDLFYSDEFCSSVTFLRNEGNNTNPIFSTAVPFNELSAPFFPVAFFEDVTGDGVRDFLMGSNLSVRSLYESDLSHSSWVSAGNNTETFQFQQNDFLQDEMIDVGDDAAPAFADEDGDGDLDLFIGNYVGSTSIGTIWLFENIGSADDPKFSLITTDYHNLSNQKLVSIKPMFADINADGMQDLVFSATNVSNSQPGIYYFENQSSTSVTLGSTIKNIPFNLLWDERVSFTDFNNDGAIDIIKGTYYGAIQLWINTGGLQFTLTDKLDYLGSGLDRTYPYTTVTDLNVDGKPDLLIGNRNGVLTMVADYKSDQSGPIEINILNLVTDEYEPSRLAGRIYPTVTRLLGTAVPQIITGTSSGGLIFLRAENDDIATLTTELEIFPNPIGIDQSLKVRSSKRGEITLFNVTGQSISSSTPIEPWITNEFDVSQVRSGVYFARFSTKDNVIIKRLIINP